MTDERHNNAIHIKAGFKRAGRKKIKGSDSIYIYGDEDQNDLMQLINDYKEEGEEIMDNSKIAELERDIRNYQQAIENAEGALDEAERELAEELDRRYNGGDTCPECNE